MRKDKYTENMSKFTEWAEGYFGKETINRVSLGFGYLDNREAQEVITKWRGLGLYDYNELLLDFLLSCDEQEVEVDMLLRLYAQHVLGYANV